MKIITVASLKGGVGKTSIAIFLSQALQESGSRMLAVDLDHNNNLTDYFLKEMDTEEIKKRNIYHAVAGQVEYADCIYRASHGIDVLPATITLSRIGLEMARDPGVILRFGIALKKLPYDSVVIDTPPALSLELTLGLYAADLVLCPVSPGRWTLQGFEILRCELARLSRTTGGSAPLFAIPSCVTPKEMKKLQSFMNGHLSEYAVTKSSTIRRATDRGHTLSVKSASHEEFRSLALEIIRERSK